MSEKLFLSIADPCHEDWSKMTPVEQGRFCSSCQKKVVDFTTQTDEEILAFFNNYNGTACGRFTDDQLDRPIQQIEFKPASSFLKYAAGLLLPAFLFATKAKGQVKEEPSKVTCDLVQPDISQMLSGKVGFVSIHPKSSSFQMNGRVIDETTNEPLAGVSIIIKGTNQGVVTDANGLYSIFLPSKKAVLQFSSVGYEMKEVKGNELNRNAATVIKMKTAAMGLIGEVIVVGYTSVRKGGVGGAVSIRTSSSISFLDSLLPAKVNVYPNPVAASGTINVSFPNVKPGMYQLRLLSATGQLFYSFQKQISGKGETEQIHLGNTTAPGIYIVQVLDEKKKIVQTTKLTIQ